MREALIITFTLIFIFVLLGVMYNLMEPYLLKLGVVGEEPIRYGGIFKSSDYGRSWNRAVEVRDDGVLGKGDINEIHFDLEDPESVYIASSSGLYVSDNLGKKWRRFVVGEFSSGATQSIAQSFENPKRMYIASYAGERGRILKTRGEGFYEVYSTPQRQDRVLGVWLNPRDEALVYAGTKSGLFLESKDFGESWKIKKDFGSAVSALHAFKEDSGTVMYMIVEQRKLFISLNEGASWRDISENFKNYTKDAVIREVLVDARDSRRLYLATRAGLLASKNGGESFFKINLLSGAASPDVSAVALDEQNNIIYVGLDNQLHKSDDGGESWQVKTINTSRKISVIEIKPDDSASLFVGTGQ